MYILVVNTFVSLCMLCELKSQVFLAIIILTNYALF